MLRISFLLLMVSVFFGVAQPSSAYAASLWNSDKNASDTAFSGKKRNLWSNLKSNVRPKGGKKPPSVRPLYMGQDKGYNYAPSPRSDLSNNVANSILLKGGNRGRSGVFDLSRSFSKGPADCKGVKGDYEKRICEAGVEKQRKEALSFAELDQVIVKALALETEAFEKVMALKSADIARAAMKRAKIKKAEAAKIKAQR